MNTGYVLFGLWLGYPSCCVQAFARMEGWCDPDHIPDEFVGTGFRPCQNCVETKPATVLLDHINRTRTCPVPFDQGIGMVPGEIERRTRLSSDGFQQWSSSLPRQHGDGIDAVARKLLAHNHFNLHTRWQPWQFRYRLD